MTRITRRRRLCWRLAWWAEGLTSWARDEGVWTLAAVLAILAVGAGVLAWLFGAGE